MQFHLMAQLLSIKSGYGLGARNHGIYFRQSAPLHKHESTAAAALHYDDVFTCKCVCKCKRLT